MTEATSTESWCVPAIMLIVLVALAAQSVRATIKTDRTERTARLLALGVAGFMGAVALGVLGGLAGEIFHAPDLSSFGAWALGALMGFAVFELGPTFLALVKRVVRRKGDKDTE